MSTLLPYPSIHSLNSGFFLHIFSPLSLSLSLSPLLWLLLPWLLSSSASLPHPPFYLASSSISSLLCLSPTSSLLSGPSCRRYLYSLPPLLSSSFSLCSWVRDALLLFCCSLLPHCCSKQQKNQFVKVIWLSVNKLRYYFKGHSRSSYINDSFFFLEEEVLFCVLTIHTRGYCYLCFTACSQVILQMCLNPSPY